MNATLPRRASTQATLRSRPAHLAVLPLLLTVALSMALGGCAAVRPGSQLQTLTARHDVSLPAAAGRPLGISTISRPWWHDLRDPALDALLSQAQARNLEVKAALAAVKEARAHAGAWVAEGRPQGSVGANAQAIRPALTEADPYRQGLPRPPEQRLVTLGQALSWEIDLFGRVDTAQAVADREVDVAQADAHAAQALMQAEVVRRYVALRLSQQAQALTAEQIQLAARRLDLLKARAEAGLADPREADSLDAELAQRRATAADWAARLPVEQAALALLLGESPAQAGPALSALQVSAALPALPEDAVLTVPADLLSRRPDVARADALLRASLGQTVLAERAHLPRLSLAATIGLQQTAGRLGQANAVRYAAGPQLQWDWLDGGRRSAQAAAARAGESRYWAQFEHTVLNALADSESALRGWQGSWQRWQQSLNGLQAATRAEQYSGRRAALGLEPTAQALGARLQALDAQLQHLTDQAEALGAYAQVQLALGAWQPEDPAASADACAPAKHCSDDASLGR